VKKSALQPGNFGGLSKTQASVQKKESGGSCAAFVVHIRLPSNRGRGGGLIVLGIFQVLKKLVQEKIILEL
jgi:hypothetical protein